MPLVVAMWTFISMIDTTPERLLHLSVFKFLWAVEISCSVELSKFYNLWSWPICAYQVMLLCKQKSCYFILSQLKHLFAWCASCVDQVWGQLESYFNHSSYRPLARIFFSIKTYAVGTQKNRFIETVLLSTQNLYNTKKIFTILFWFFFFI